MTKRWKEARAREILNIKRRKDNKNETKENRRKKDKKGKKRD